MCFNFFLERKKKRIPGQRKCLIDNLNGTNELFNKIFNFFFFFRAERPQEGLCAMDHRSYNVSSESVIWRSPPPAVLDATE